ncbi:uncharacterized protein EDB91DRAFT_1153082 [Suillus paluster]|uniref:uncharacterized protein n=1 Tax=Suillus paluster TaxID=48578 RepID=UPI001B8852F6|nr:uncharacterized protein EDB91DRAFT_1153082 [Suillus paluster]KAG1731811.1 hypothetical protein EDB91DRAFT_1153082 [Suillus paluster]
MHCSLIFVCLLVSGFCVAQNYTLPQCAEVCAGTAATAAGCYSYSNATCPIQTCFNTNCNTTTQGSAWQYYSNLCTGAKSTSGKTTTIKSTSPEPVSTTSHTSTTSHASSAPTSSVSSSASTNISNTTTSASQTPTSKSGALGTDVMMKLRGIMIMAVVAGGVLIL